MSKAQQQSFSKEDEEHIHDFYRNYYNDAIADLARKYPNDKSSLWIDYSDLYAFDMDIADDLLNHPEDIQTLFETALETYDVPIPVDLSDATVRFHNLNQTKKVDQLRADDVDSYVAISGQISKASAIRPVVKTAAWECQRCGTQTQIPQSGEDLQQPHECKGCERQGPFELNYEQSTVRNHQLIRIKQPPEEATNSSQVGNEIDAHVEGDMVGFAEAGERADVCGILRADTSDDDPTLEFYFDAWAIDKREDDYSSLNLDEHVPEVRETVQEGNPYKLLAETIAPGIVGGRDVDIETPWGDTYDKYWWIRLATGIANLFSGWRRPNGDGTYHRGNSHTALIGDPSTGKSTIMGAIEEIAPRSASESGKNASGPGLTAAAVKDDFGDSQWSLEAGALVKAHNGVACIDEIDKMQKDGLSRLHSALEKQRLEINKAGIDATLKCETSLLAAGNPKDSRFDSYDADHAQIDIVGSLMDRFDLIYTLKDRPDEAKDAKIAESAIEERAESGLVHAGQMDPEERETATAALEMDTLQAWVAYARQQFTPVIRRDDVKERLKDYYVEIRQENGTGDEEPVPATVRTLDGLLRLSEASARMRLSEEVEPIDVEMAIALVKISLQDVGYDPETGKMDADFAAGRKAHSQRDRIKRIEGIVETLESDDNAPSKADVLEAAAEAGIDKDKAEHEIEKLKQQGELYTPQKGHLRTT